MSTAAWFNPGMPSHPTSRVIPANDYRRERWKNQLGWTRQIVRVPDDDDWQWRLSIAEIERDADFSTFPGVERELVLLRGNGMQLRFDDGTVADLAPPQGRLRFDGARAVHGALVDGPTHDFNLMWRRAAIDAQLWVRPLVGPMVLFVDPQATWAVHLVAGSARFADQSGLPPLQQGDTALLAARDTRLRFVIDGGGTLLIARIDPAEAQ